MLDQLHLYLLCYAMGWLPLRQFHRFVEQKIPFSVQPSKATFSTLPFLHLLYMGLEIFRAYFLMHVVHQWLAFDIDLLIGLALFLAGIGYPIFVSTGFRTPLLLSVLGLYGFLFPMLFWVIPCVVLALFFLQVPQQIAYALIGGFFIAMGWLQGGNSLYISVYVGLAIYLAIKTMPVIPSIKKQ